MSGAAFDRRSSLSGPVQLHFRGQALASCQVAHAHLSARPVWTGCRPRASLRQSGHAALALAAPWMHAPAEHGRQQCGLVAAASCCWLHALMAACWLLIATCCCWASLLLQNE